MYHFPAHIYSYNKELLLTDSSFVSSLTTKLSPNHNNHYPIWPNRSTAYSPHSSAHPPFSQIACSFWCSSFCNWIQAALSRDCGIIVWSAGLQTRHFIDCVLRSLVQHAKILFVFISIFFTHVYPVFVLSAFLWSSSVSHSLGLPWCHGSLYSVPLLSSSHPLYLCWVDKAQGHSRVSILCLNTPTGFLSSWRPSLLYNGCLPLYSLIKALADSPNQIIPYKQKDLLLLVIDFLLSSLFWLWLTK